jgi:hypothetical protein
MKHSIGDQASEKPIGFLQAESPGLSSAFRVFCSEWWKYRGPGGDFGKHPTLLRGLLRWDEDTPSHLQQQFKTR